MCLAVPLKIASIDGNNAIGERDGIKRDIRIDFIKEPRIGDYVIVHAGFAIEKLSKEQAELDLAAAKELSDELSRL